MKILRKIGDKLFYRGGIFHPTKGLSLRWEKDLELAIKEGKKIINIGAGQHRRPGIINIDPSYKEEDEWTIRAYGEDLPFEDNSVDFVICNAVLEHVKEPRRIVNEIYRVLEPRGKTYIDIAFLQPFHAAPNDYNRLTLDGFEYLCRNFEKIQSGICLGPGSALAQFLVSFSQIIFKGKTGKRIMKNVTKIFVFPLKYLDKFLVKNNESTKLAGGVYFYGKKP